MQSSPAPSQFSDGLIIRVDADVPEPVLLIGQDVDRDGTLAVAITTGCGFAHCDQANRQGPATGWCDKAVKQVVCRERHSTPSIPGYGVDSAGRATVPACERQG